MENICSDKVSQNGSENSSVLSGIVSPLLNGTGKIKGFFRGEIRITPIIPGYRRSCSSRPRVEVVKPYFIRFITELPDPAALASCPEKKLMKLWEGLGYYNRVRNMQAAAVQLWRNMGKNFLKSMKKLMSLKGYRKLYGRSHCFYCIWHCCSCCKWKCSESR